MRFNDVTNCVMILGIILVVHLVISVFPGIWCQEREITQIMPRPQSSIRPVFEGTLGF